MAGSMADVPLLRIKSAKPLGGFRVRLVLTDGSAVERDLERLVSGGIFAALRKDPARFREFAVEGGTIAWPNGADLCPDVLIWGGPPPTKRATPPKNLALEAPADAPTRGRKRRAS